MNAKLKVLHLSSERTWRGGEQQIAYLIEEQLSNGLDVMVALREGSEFQKHCEAKHINFVPLPFKNSFDLKTARGISQICKREKIEVVHMHSAKSHAVAILAAVFGNTTPLVLSRRVDFVPKSNWLTRFKYNHQAIKRIVGVSHKITEIMKGYVADPSKCVTIHSGVDLQKFRARPTKKILREEFNVPSNVIIIGNTSALEGHKDYFTFLDTIAEVIKHNQSIKAFIVGDGSLKQELQAYATSKNIESHVVFTGFRKDIINVLTSFDIFLMTSNEEGLGTSVLDAFLAGIPVVATAAGGIPEMVVNNETGLLAPIRSSEVLAKHVQSLIADLTLQKRLVEGALRKVNSFSKKITAEKTISLYHEILATK